MTSLTRAECHQYASHSKFTGTAVKNTEYLLPEKFWLATEMKPSAYLCTSLKTNY